MADYGIELADKTSGCYQRVFVKKKQGASLGLVLKGGVETGLPITIDHIRPGSVAERSECLMCGDILAAINDIVTSQLSRSELAVMLRNAGPNLCLDIVFDSSLGVVHNKMQYESRKLRMTLLRPSDVTFGLVLRTIGEDVIVTHIRSGSAVDCDGRLRIGDRLNIVSTNEKVESDDNDIFKDCTMTQQEMLNILQNNECVNIEFVYQISIQEELSDSRGGLLVEIDKITQSARLGLTFMTFQGHILIDTIDTASIAERCGALHPGDCVLAVNGVKPLTSQQASRLLTFTAPSTRGHVVRLEILPQEHRDRSLLDDCIIPLTFDPRNGCLGFTCSQDSQFIRIISLFENSSAERCGLICEGDTLLAIDGIKLTDIDHYESVSAKLLDNCVYDIKIEFNVDKPMTKDGEEIDVSIPSDTVTLGITISNLQTEDKSIIISDVKNASISYRCGLIAEGDRLLSVNNEMVTCDDLRAAALMLQASNVKTIRIRKARDENLKHSSDCKCTDILTDDSDLDSIEYTVTLPRKKQQSLGITISGTENHRDVIVISAMAEQGLAARTGAVQIGDRLTEINGSSLEHLPLSDALKLLSNAGDMVTMKISRKLTGTKSKSAVKTNDSIDSALESWDSSGHDSHQEAIGQPLAASSPWQLQPKQLLSTSTSRKRTTLGSMKPHFTLSSQDEEDLPPPPQDWNSSGTSISTSEEEWSTKLYQLKEKTSSDNNLHGDHFRQHIRVLLERDKLPNKGFGFGVSDGCKVSTNKECCENDVKGVYVSALRIDGPADKAGLKRFDQILKVNSIIVKNLDVAGVVALISESKIKMHLVIARTLTSKSIETQFF